MCQRDPTLSAVSVQTNLTALQGYRMKERIFIHCLFAILCRRSGHWRPVRYWLSKMAALQRARPTSGLIWRHACGTTVAPIDLRKSSQMLQSSACCSYYRKCPKSPLSPTGHSVSQKPYLPKCLTMQRTPRTRQVTRTQQENGILRVDCASPVISLGAMQILCVDAASVAKLRPLSNSSIAMPLSSASGSVIP